VVRQIEKAGGEGFFVQTDVSKSADIEAMVARTVEKFGRLDCAFNNAGITGPVMVPVAEIEEKGWDETMNVNLKAVWLCMKYEIRAMLKNGKGSIVNCFVDVWVGDRRRGECPLLREQNMGWSG